MTSPSTDNTVTTDFEHNSCSKTISGGYEGPLCEACNDELETKLRELWGLIKDLYTSATPEGDR